MFEAHCTKTNARSSRFHLAFPANENSTPSITPSTPTASAPIAERSPSPLQSSQEAH